MLSDMNANKFEEHIRSLHQQLSKIGPLRPGTLYKRSSVCGKPGCRCIREKDPQRHGPYYYLSYTFEGKSYTEFVREKDLTGVKKQIRNYNRLMKLVKKLISYSIRLARLKKTQHTSSKEV